MQQNPEQKRPFLGLFQKASSLIYLVILCALLQLAPSFIYYARSPKSAVQASQIEKDVQGLYQKALQRDREDLQFIQALSSAISVTLDKVWIDESQPQLIHCQLAKSSERSKLALYLQAASQKRTGSLKQLKPLVSNSDSMAFISLAKDRDASKILTLSRASIRTNFSPSSLKSFAISNKTKQDLTRNMQLAVQDLITCRPSALGLSPQFIDFLLENQLSEPQIRELAKEVLFWESFLSKSPASHQFFVSVIQKSAALETNKIKELASLFNKEAEALLERAQEKKDPDSVMDQEEIDLLNQAAISLKNLLLKETTKLSHDQHPLFQSIASDSEGVTLLIREFATEKELSQQMLKRALSIVMQEIHETTGILFTKDSDERYRASSPLQGEGKGAFALAPLHLFYQDEAEKVFDLLSRITPRSKELSPENFPIIDPSIATVQIPYLGIRITTLDSEPVIILEGIRPLLDTLKMRENKEAADTFFEDATAIDQALSSRGYRIDELSMDEMASLWQGEDAIKRYRSAAVYRMENPVHALVSLTRLPWKQVVKVSDNATEKTAIFHFTTQEARLKMLNRIDDMIHEEHLQERDSYEKAQSDLNKEVALLYPKPRHNLLLDNIALSLRKILRGDQNSALKWGLDLYGGKTVRIALEDSNGKKAVETAQLEQAQSELGSRLNKLGLSEVAIRIEGEYLVLDFPSSQNMKASELIESAKMRFHVVNETFSSANISLAQDVRAFLSEVMQETQQSSHVVTMESLTSSAAQLLGFGENGVIKTPRTPSAKKLRESGLKILPISQYHPDSALETEYSLVLPQRGQQEQMTPLIVFANHALSGKDLESVRANYDPEHGHTLGFSVASNNSSDDESPNPQDTFAAWTKKFSTSGIRKTPYESTTQGRGWRMAVALNAEIVSAPTLSTELRDQAMIHGQFSQREVEHLVSDLKAGSLSFTPKILSEENISPELGAKDRSSGLYAALCGFALVVALMSGYYGFAGRVASSAVFFNLLLTWAILQYLGAALTLSGIAALVLTVGMSVDANVLIFERMREELAKNISLKGAIISGYARAYSAIIDSNLTTILAALILIQFDSGPIKGFAITLIVGIASSMFTALFMTKTFFQAWSSLPGRELKLHRWLPEKIHFDFFKWKKSISVLWVIFTLSGLALIFQQRQTVLGMDFTGGYSIEMTFDESQMDGTQKPQDRRDLVRKALETAGIESSFIEMREFEGSSRMKLQLHGAVDQSVFKHLDQSPAAQAERIAFVKNALQEKGLFLKESVEELETKYSSVSGQFSSLMRRNALTAIAVALLAILAYLAVRFEWRFALSAVAGLGCDVLATLSAIGWLRLMGMPIKLDLQAIGAIMTIIGYALNDTIIIFDRIRETGSCQLGSRPAKTINQALCETLSRTLMTSGTTLVALLSLNILGGGGLLSFSMIMTTGIIVGTFCSLFITSYLLRFIWKNTGAIGQIEIEKSSL